MLKQIIDITNLPFFGWVGWYVGHIYHLSIITGSCLALVRLYDMFPRIAGHELSCPSSLSRRCPGQLGMSCLIPFLLRGVLYRSAWYKLSHHCLPSQHAAQAHWVHVVMPLFTLDPSPSRPKPPGYDLSHPYSLPRCVAQAWWVRVIPPLAANCLVLVCLLDAWACWCCSPPLCADPGVNLYEIFHTEKIQKVDHEAVVFIHNFIIQQLFHGANWCKCAGVLLKIHRHACMWGYFITCNQVYRQDFKLLMYPRKMCIWVSLLDILTCLWYIWQVNCASGSVDHYISMM